MPTQNGRPFTDDFFICIFLNEHAWLMPNTLKQSVYVELNVAKDPIWIIIIVYIARIGFIFHT